MQYINFPLVKFTPKIPNISIVRTITTPTPRIPPAEFIKVVTNNLIDLFYEISLNGLKALNNLRILTKLKSIVSTKTSINEHITIMKSNLFQLSLKYDPGSKINPKAMIFKHDSIPKKKAKK